MMQINAIHGRKLAPVSKARKTGTARLWASYERAMLAAQTTSLALADALERYLRAGLYGWHSPFHAACQAADVHQAALRSAAQYHFATIAGYTSGHVINLDETELLGAMRELRGTALPVVTGRPDGGKVVTYRYADDGIAGYFAQELRSMRRFGSPRRRPSYVSEFFSRVAIDVSASVGHTLDMQTMTLADVLTDLRHVSDYEGARCSLLDDNGAALIELGLAEREGVQGLRTTDAGLDVLFATRNVLLDCAA